MRCNMSNMALCSATFRGDKALSKVFIGTNNATHAFNGHISRVKYYNRAITAQEVMDLYVKGPLPASFWWSSIKNRIKVTLDINQ